MGVIDRKIRAEKWDLAAKEQGMAAFTVVRANAELKRGVTVKVHGGTTEVTLGDKPLIRVQKSGENEAIISFLDLRPLGLRLHGNADQLVFGTNTFVNNNFESLGVMIGVP